MIKVIHERKKCIGCGLCASICPKYWEITEDGKSKLLDSKEVSDGNYELEVEAVECIKEAAESCPAQCIKIKQ